MTTATPIAREERIGMLDTLRGVAVLGILLMNITAFGLPIAYEDPTNWGGAAGANLAAWRSASLLVEGTMRGLFTLLFGAGALLFLQRHASGSSGSSSGNLYFRRMAWLIAFGLINGYLLLWPGDILFYYGVVGLLLFVFRNMVPRRLITVAAVLMLLQTAVSVVEWLDYHRQSEAAQTARAAREMGRALTDEQQTALDRLAWTHARFKPSQRELQARVSEVRRGYTSALQLFARETWHNETSFFLRHGLLESVAMMLLGMALLQLGILTGSAPARLYAWLALGGYALGVPVNLFETERLIRSGFSVDTLMASYLTYDLGRIPMTLGHLGVIGLAYRAGMLPTVRRRFAAVGQMALTNYLAQSVLCMLLFTGAGLGLYGQLERYQLYYIVAIIWALQWTWSAWWLDRFRFGPAEWLWRSLTYGRVMK